MNCCHVLRRGKKSRYYNSIRVRDDWSSPAIEIDDCCWPQMSRLKFACSMVYPSHYITKWSYFVIELVYLLRPYRQLIKNCTLCLLFYRTFMLYCTLFISKEGTLRWHWTYCVFAYEETYTSLIYEIHFKWFLGLIKIGALIILRHLYIPSTFTFQCI